MLLNRGTLRGIEGSSRGSCRANERVNLMANECDMSFADLFNMAKKRAWTPDEERKFAALDPQSRNALVKQLAKEAGRIDTEDRLGTDGITYTAFWVEGA